MGSLPVGTVSLLLPARAILAAMTGALPVPAPRERLVNSGQCLLQQRGKATPESNTEEPSPCVKRLLLIMNILL